MSSPSSLTIRLIRSYKLKTRNTLKRHKLYSITTGCLNSINIRLARFTVESNSVGVSDIIRAGKRFKEYVLGENGCRNKYFFVPKRQSQPTILCHIKCGEKTTHEILEFNHWTAQITVLNPTLKIFGGRSIDVLLIRSVSTSSICAFKDVIEHIVLGSLFDPKSSAKIRVSVNLLLLK
ncbi:hypothetical protein PHYBLDRAFT_65401 [Phycomyces blakesleeanus NRRL 1555(-)]|uniref:Uncharacterized protein n=1 Tax=Phycomyces blakesleeanus (strain ATCC 8743b / DSM 1359 / FGSC 10004 / NBRC 33097 / NRRL 1555) TaxID=763407 RepID=A0A162PSQ7_PHYB8|nr:hypothetical protein PHYBLDRAFT_65401 [Phycomyces blakesleeanus NRRL 1555(-)]OAD72556.1 hypothetical protein PHYBLDRAFT_65401 [Phycomyces blakesleeanus NRRL 1555(-)]|eukprot:XP_018290596.1 hypothetical protein PHYBLDRAFT_65401 [Phycomyces blakesleeanus NRRL 1555(-)]